jgi:tRNA pseudouridine38-40 synthase
MAERLKLIVAYDGAPFSGWQSQTNGNGIQDHLEKAFAKILGESVRVHGAGRTDAGVHALAQVAHADLPKRRYTAERWTKALNGLLPLTIRVMRCRFVSGSFHARFSAKGKIYRYRILNADVVSPLENGRVWHVREPLDCAKMAAAARLFIGRHDFRSFAANRGAPSDDTTRTMRNIRVRCSGSLISVEFDGEGFLYKMARLITGALVEAASGEASLSEIGYRLTGNDRLNSSRRLVAPAAGLFLLRVRY